MITMALKGAKEFESAVKQLEKNVKRASRFGVTKGANLIVKAAKSNLSKNKESGALAKSITKKIKIRKGETNAIAVIGPKTSAEKEWKGKTRKPSRYAHLVHNGHIDAKTGKHTAGNPFLKNAFEQQKDAAVRETTKAFIAKLSGVK